MKRAEAVKRLQRLIAAMKPQEAIDISVALCDKATELHQDGGVVEKEWAHWLFIVADYFEKLSFAEDSDKSRPNNPQEAKSGL